MPKNLRIIPGSGSIYFIQDGVAEADALKMTLSNSSNNVRIQDGTTGTTFLFFDKTNLRTEVSSSFAIPNASSNPASAPVGGIYFNTADGNIYRANGSSWAAAAGTSGSSGAKGQKGEVGVSGSSGTSGSNGTNGSSGTSGATGAKGQKGEIGAPGPQGNKGNTGSPGPQGNKGDTGAPGPQGNKGNTGAPGPQGNKGNTGAPGPQGNKGEVGASGSSGTSGGPGGPGAKGNTGSPGPKGNTGSPGPKGNTGTKGTTGTGTKGQKGETGTNAGITSFTNGADNRVITATSSTGLNAEANLTFDGTNLSCAGDVIAFATSDIRFKDNIKPIKNALEKVLKLNGVTWDWNDKTNPTIKSNVPNIGLIAQEVQQVLPEVVSERENGYLSLNYEKMMGLIVEAIKELANK
jgi:hypothetical protein